MPEITADLICDSYAITGLGPITGDAHIINGKTCAIGVLYKRFGDGSGLTLAWMHNLIGPEEARDLYSGFDNFSNYREGRPYYNIGREAAKRMGLD